MIDRNSSKGTFLGRNSANRKPSGGPKALPSIDHAKNMEKLRSITGRSSDFAATASSADSNNIQFSKPKIGIKNRVSNSTKGLKDSRISSKPDLRPSRENGGAMSALSEKDMGNPLKPRKRVASQGMRMPETNKGVEDGAN